MKCCCSRLAMVIPARQWKYKLFKYLDKNLKLQILRQRLFKSQVSVYIVDLQNKETLQEKIDIYHQHYILAI